MVTAFGVRVCRCSPSPGDLSARASSVPDDVIAISGRVVAPRYAIGARAARELRHRDAATGLRRAVGCVVHLAAAWAERWTTRVTLSFISSSFRPIRQLSQYPDAKRMVAYGEFRKGFKGDKDDTRLVAYGVRSVVERFLLRRWTVDDLDRADRFLSTHNAGNTPFPWPRDLFERFIAEKDGYFPVRVQALPEGTCCHARVPIYQIVAEEPYARLVTFFETMLTMVWYPTTVATLSRRGRDVIEAAWERTADGGAADPAIAYSLHDFGFRGCCTLEQAVLGGVSHLLSFAGSDTMAACWFAQERLNRGVPVATSIPASEHSVMTAWPTERGAVEHLIETFGDGRAYAIVMDSYDYVAALTELLPAVRPLKLAKGGVLVVRPDSGDPVWAVMEGLKALETCFGVDVNAKGFKVIRGARVIQGDGIDVAVMGRILAAAEAGGFSAECCAFGMGGGLLQRVDRDTLSFATKLCLRETRDGERRLVMKRPATDPSKASHPGELEVRRVDGVPTVFPKGGAPAAVVAASDEAAGGDGDLLRTVYDCGPVDGGGGWGGGETFEDVRARVRREWAALPPRADPVSAELVAVRDAHLAATTAGGAGGRADG